MAESIVAGVYEKAIDRESAHETIKSRTQARMGTEAEAKQNTPKAGGAAPATSGAPAAEPEGPGIMGSLGNLLGGGAKGSRTSVGEQLFKSAASAIGGEIGRRVIRGVLGGIFGGRR